MMLALARDLRRLHDAARPAPPDRRRPLRADAGERRPAPRRTGPPSTTIAPTPTGIGFDRTRRGSDAVDQYRSPLRERWNDPATCPENLLLWFHRLPWDYRLASGRTLWDGLVRHYSRGRRAGARDGDARGQRCAGKVDDERHRAVLAKLRTQAAEAAAWRDKSLALLPAVQRAAAGGPQPQDEADTHDTADDPRRAARRGRRSATRWATSPRTSSSSR